VQVASKLRPSVSRNERGPDFWQPIAKRRIAKVDKRVRGLNMKRGEVSMIHTLKSWLSNPAVEIGLGVFSLVAVLASLLLVPWFLARLPRDYLRHAQPRDHSSLPLRILRNLLGLLLALLGFAMLLLPGQGLLTLLVGVLLVDFPGKHALVVRLLSRPKVLALVNKLRARRHSPPLAT
jgi:hypothetical protein